MLKPTNCTLIHRPTPIWKTFRGLTWIDTVRPASDECFVCLLVVLSFRCLVQQLVHDWFHYIFHRTSFCLLCCDVANQQFGPSVVVRDCVSHSRISGIDETQCSPEWHSTLYAPFQLRLFTRVINLAKYTSFHSWLIRSHCIHSNLRPSHCESCDSRF